MSLLFPSIQSQGHAAPRHNWFNKWPLRKKVPSFSRCFLVGESNGLFPTATEKSATFLTLSRRRLFPPPTLIAAPWRIVVCGEKWSSKTVARKSGAVSEEGKRRNWRFFYGHGPLRLARISWVSADNLRNKVDLPHHEERPWGRPGKRDFLSFLYPSWRRRRRWRRRESF